MRRKLSSHCMAILGALTILSFGQALQGAEIISALKMGDRAPDFELKDQNNKPVRLSDFLGKKNVVLAFYVLAFTGG